MGCSRRTWVHALGAMGSLGVGGLPQIHLKLVKPEVSQSAFQSQFLLILLINHGLGISERGSRTSIVFVSISISLPSGISVVAVCLFSGSCKWNQKPATVALRVPRQLLLSVIRMRIRGVMVNTHIYT